MRNPINKSGKEFENKRKNFLKKNDIPFKKGGTQTIDFEILTKPTIWLECTNQTGSGSTYEKLPNKVMKYIRRKKITDTIYVERGIKIPNKDITDNLKQIEDFTGVNIKVLTSSQTDDLILNKSGKSKFTNAIEKFI